MKGGRAAVAREQYDRLARLNDRDGTANVYEPRWSVPAACTPASRLGRDCRRSPHKVMSILLDDLQAGRDAQRGEAGLILRYAPWLAICARESSEA